MKTIYTTHNFAKRLVMMLAVGMLAVNVWGTAPTVSDLNLGTPLVTENFNSLATCNNTPGNGSTTTTISSQTAYGVLTDGYVGKSASIGFGIFAAEDPFVSKYLKVYGDGSKVAGLYLNNTSISATGSFDIYFSKTSVGYFGLFSAVDNSNTSNKSYNVVYFYWDGTTLKISDGNASSHTWQPVGTPTSDLIRVTVVYNSGSNTTYCGTAISISSAKAHVYVNGTAVMDGESPKEFTIPTSRNPYYFRVTTNSSNGLSIDDLKIYNGLPTAAGYAVTYNNGGHGTAPSNTTATSVTLAAITGVTGWTCTGWKANVAVTNTSTSASISAGTLIPNGTGVTLSQATTFTAQWETTKYTVSFGVSPAGYGTVSQASVANVPHGTVPTSSTNTVTVNGTTVTATPHAQDADYNYAFSSWSNVPGSVTGAVTITANFTRTPRALKNYRTVCSSTYNIVLDDGLDATTNNGSAKVAANGTSLTNLVAPTKSGYDVEGYYTTSELTTKIATNVGALQNGSGSGITVGGNAWTNSSREWVRGAGETFFAKWTAHEYTITYEGLEGATNTNPTSYTIETATINLANPGSRTGYTFTGWTIGGSPITQIVLGTTGDKTITATWSINTPNLAVSAADHVVITATPASESAIAEGANRNVNYNKTVTLNCTPDEHWNLVWDVYKTGESSTKVALSGSGDGATFTMPDYAVTVSAVMTEAAYKTVCFKNNGEDIDGYASVKVYVGESPVAPTLTDGTSGDACDPTSDKHYGWTKETWTSTIATQSEIDARTGTEAVYAKSAALPVVAAEDPATITYHAVWAAGSGSPAITPPTPIVYWERQSIAADKDISATTGTGTLRSNAAFTEATYIKVYNCTSLPSTPTVTLSGLNMSGATGSAVAISFYTRGTSASAGTLTVKYTDGGVESTAGTVDVANGLIRYHEVNGIPKTATQIKLEHSKSSGNLAIGTIRIFEPNTTEYTFTELDGTNTDGWTNNDWDGYYLITNASTYALDGNGIGEKNFATVSPSDNKIVTTNIGAAFEVTYVSENGYKIQGVGCGDYLNTASNSVAPSASVIYHSSMSYNSVVDNSSNTLKWNSSKFGFYASAGTAIKLYKILASYSTFLTTCCTQYDISGASTSGTAVTGGTLTSTDNSACEDREVKITANVSDGYRFDSWTITAGGSPVARKDGSAEIEDGKPIYVFDMPAADVTVSVAFTRVYTVTYDANGGTGEMIDVNSPYAAGDKVTMLTNTFTKAGYNFDSWSYSPAVSVTDGKFDMPSSDVAITAQWTAKPLNSITITPSSGEVYVGQYVDFTVSYDPADYLSPGYTLKATPVYVAKETAAPANTKLRLKGGRASGPGASITETVNETVTIQASGDNTKTASVNMTVNPLPRVHFEDIIHNVEFSDVVEEIVGNVLSGAKTTPTHSDVSDPGENYNSCERGHLHLLGWIESTWADAHPGATSGEITGAGSSIYYEAGASINVEVQNGKTFYAVWCIVE